MRKHIVKRILVLCPDIRSDTLFIDPVPVGSIIVCCWDNNLETVHHMKEFPVQRPELAEALFADWQELESFKDAQGEIPEGQRSLEEASFLFRRSAEEDDELLREINNIDKLRRVAGQQAISGPIIGMASVARSTMATTSYYGYKNNPISANRLALAGRISQSVGQSYSLIATPTAQIKGYFNTKKLIRQHQLPAQILNDRLQILDSLKARIEKSHMH